MRITILWAFFAFVASMTVAEEASFEKCHKYSTDAVRLMCYDKQTSYKKGEASGGVANSNSEVAKPVQEDRTGRQWDFSTENSALDNRKDVWLSVESNNTEGNAIGSPIRARLWLRCMENKTNLLINFDRYTTDNQNVLFKLDDGPVQKQWMETVRGGDGIGIWTGGRAIPFIKSMFSKKELIVSYDTYTGPVEFIFNISGLRDRIDPLSEACKWKP